MPRRERVSGRLREAPNLFLNGPAFDRDVDVNAVRAGRLRVGGYADLGKSVANGNRGFADARKRRRAARAVLDRVEIEVQDVRPVDVVAVRVPGVEIDAAEV